MQQEIFKLAMSQGIWAALFVGLLFYVLRENAKREERLMQCLEKMQVDISDIRESLRRLTE